MVLVINLHMDNSVCKIKNLVITCDKDCKCNNCFYEICQNNKIIKQKRLDFYWLCSYNSPKCPSHRDFILQMKLGG